jgi:hypothetical protein
MEKKEKIDIQLKMVAANELEKSIANELKKLDGDLDELLLAQEQSQSNDER